MVTDIPDEKTVGRFTYKGGAITGPAQYLEDRGIALLETIKAGQDPVFNKTWHKSPDIITALLVRLQNDYTGWHGVMEMMFKLGPERKN